MRLDKRLNFEHQLAHISDICRRRSGILKIINNKCWHLNEKSQKIVYYAMVRSTMEYSAFIFNILPINAKKKLEAIQNNALRRIYKKDRRFGNANLLELAEESTIEERMQTLHEKYMLSAIESENPLISLIHEYQNYKGGRTISVATPLFHASTTIDNIS